MTEWLTNLDDLSHAEVDEALAYLEQHGRAAALPDVRHRIQTSRHFPDMSEVRVDIDHRHVYIGCWSASAPTKSRPFCWPATRLGSETPGTKPTCQSLTNGSTSTSLPLRSRKKR